MKTANLIIALLCSATLVAQKYVTTWQTAPALNKYMEVNNVLMTEGDASSSNKVVVSPSQKYQSIDGFGWTLTEASAKLMMEMSQSARKTLLSELFADNGKVRSSVLRIGLGATDLSEYSYTYSNSKDESLSNFSLDGPDKDYLLPVLKEIISVNPDIFIVATPWTAPVWMKNSWLYSGYMGGSLKSEYFGTYANYILKYFQAMKAEGINVGAISVQNEPLNGSNNPSMYMSKEDMYTFVDQHLGPTLKNNGFGSVRIIGYDHNCDNTEYPIYVAKSSYIQGTAFHLYSGDISALTTVHNATGKDVYFTEQYMGNGGDVAGDFAWHMQNVMVGSVNNYARFALEWNLANNTAMDIHTSGGCDQCLGALTIDGGQIQARNASYYVVAQMNRAVKPGAIRLATSGGNNLKSTAFLNPDGSVVVVVANTLWDKNNVTIAYNNNNINVTIEMGGAVTILLPSSGGSDTNPTNPTENEALIYANVPLQVSDLYLYVLGNYEPMTQISQSANSKKFYSKIQCSRQSLKFKLAAGSNADYLQTVPEYSFAALDTDNDGIVTVDCRDFNKVYTSIMQGDMLIRVTSAPAGTDSIYLVGSWGHGWWLSESIACSRMSDGTWEGTVPNANTFTYKCWNRIKVDGKETWEYEEAADSNGKQLPQDRSADYSDSPIQYIQVLYWMKQAETTPVTENYDFLLTSPDAVYYNLQGMRVEPPLQKGIYIKVDNNKSEKLMIR